jgi:hypothetical protein
LEAQLQRLEQFLVFSDDSRQELATVNLLVQRNIPVTFAKTAIEIINETLDPEGQEPKILRAVPVHPITKNDAATSGTKSKQSVSESKIKKATPVERGRRN